MGIWAKNWSVQCNPSSGGFSRLSFCGLLCEPVAPVLMGFSSGPENTRNGDTTSVFYVAFLQRLSLQHYQGFYWQ